MFEIGRRRGLHHGLLVGAALAGLSVAGCSGELTRAGNAGAAPTDDFPIASDQVDDETGATPANAMDPSHAVGEAAIVEDTETTSGGSATVETALPDDSDSAGPNPQTDTTDEDDPELDSDTANTGTIDLGNTEGSSDYSAGSELAIDTFLDDTIDETPSGPTEPLVMPQ